MSDVKVDIPLAEAVKDIGVVADQMRRGVPDKAKWRPAVGERAVMDDGTVVNVRGFTVDGENAYIEVENGAYTRVPVDSLSQPAMEFQSCRKDDACWFKDGHAGACHILEVQLERPQWGKVPSKAEWKPGMQVQTPEWEGVAVIVAVTDGDAWVRCQEEHAIVALSELRRPAPRTRDVMKQVWLYVMGSKLWAVEAEAYAGLQPIAGPISVTFPGVPVDGGVA